MQQAHANPPSDSSDEEEERPSKAHLEKHRDPRPPEARPPTPAKKRTPEKKYRGAGTPMTRWEPRLLK